MRRFATTLSYLSVLAGTKRQASDSVVVSDETISSIEVQGEWETALEAKFGVGTHRLRRSLFKEFCDESRAEVYSKPPTPFGQWTVHHENRSDLVSFRCAREHTADGVECLVIARLKFADPPGKADHCVFVDNHFVDIFMERNGVILAYEVALVERTFEVKNIKVFESEMANGVAQPLAATASAIAERKTELYDGPSILHLEEDFYNELHDLLICAEMDLTFQDWVVKWISYLEHVEYLRWSLSVQSSVLPLNEITINELLTSTEESIATETLDTWRREGKQ